MFLVFFSERGIVRDGKAYGDQRGILCRAGSSSVLSATLLIFASGYHTNEDISAQSPVDSSKLFSEKVLQTLTFIQHPAEHNFAMLPVILLKEDALTIL